MINPLKLRAQYRANIYAQAFAFILNASLFGITSSNLFIWCELACLCFIANHTAKSPKFIDRNILNHFFSVMCYYLISVFVENIPALYLCLVFVFTYFYFILKDNGYNRSLHLWMYIQALLIGTTFTDYPFEYKILATILGYIEAQLLLNLVFKFMSNNETHEAESDYLNIFKIPITTWFDGSKAEVKLAIRGAFTAAITYAICSNFHDIKPNWAVVAAISCLQRDDYEASIRSIKAIAIGSLTGWPIAMVLIFICGNHSEIGTAMIWIFMLSGLVCSFELIIRPNLYLQIFSALTFLLAISAVAIALKIDSYNYLNLKVINSLIGVVISLIVLFIWDKLNKTFKEIKQ